MIDDVNARKAALDAEKADLAKQQDQLKTAMDGLAGKMSANRAAWEQNKARREDLSAKMAVAEASLADQCKDTPLDQRNAPQYLTYCAAPDTIDRVLKSLDEVAPPQGTPARSN
jgi:chromosome segregation ATPase